MQPNTLIITGLTRWVLTVITRPSAFSLFAYYAIHQWIAVFPFSSIFFLFFFFFSFKCPVLQEHWRPTTWFVLYQLPFRIEILCSAQTTDVSSSSMKFFDGPYLPSTLPWMISCSNLYLLFLITWPKYSSFRLLISPRISVRLLIRLSIGDPCRPWNPQHPTIGPRFKGFYFLAHSVCECPAFDPI